MKDIIKDYRSTVIVTSEDKLIITCRGCYNQGLRYNQNIRAELRRVDSDYYQPIKLIRTEVEINIDGDEKKESSFYCKRCAIDFVNANLLDEVMSNEATAHLTLIDTMLPYELTKEEWDIYNDWELRRREKKKDAEKDRQIDIELEKAKQEYYDKTNRKGHLFKKA